MRVFWKIEAVKLLSSEKEGGEIFILSNEITECSFPNNTLFDVFVTKSKVIKSNFNSSDYNYFELTES